ncbi:mitochondrial partitioning protein [Geosmithia morbida]|uniref:Mitochondrial partitioning protein n=1 Tax=Geosmithia morbida TaxID=1094350 RepID=A0A9P5D1Z8_9HYPO|nr:mitochondrial partitioning protein [Geosmithia morbida]KAF4123302.1 mitochondrial partitioning protein [Geosmithia morbida]
MREIVTLQLGHLSNYTGTHFWNAQESYFTYSSDETSPIDHNIHWRPGIGADGSETFLPRTVIYDLKGGFGSLRKINALYEPEPQPEQLASLWSGKSVVEKQPPIEPSEYQASLDAGTMPPALTQSSVRFWSDFSHVFYHPKSLVQLYDFELDSTIRPFERHDMGVELFGSLDRDDDIVDRDFRPFVEECDQMQGVQTLATIDDAWGGFAARYLDALRDEYPKTSLWLWGLQSPDGGVLPREKRQLRIVNTAQTIAHVCSTASVVVPLGLPATLPSNMAGLDTRSPWHVSAAYATAIETATLPSRLAVPGAISLSDLAQSLNTGGHQTLARLRMKVGGAANKDADFFGIGLLKNNARRKPEKTGNVFGQLTSSHGPGPSKQDDKEAEQADPRSRRIVGDFIYENFDSSLKFPLLDSFPSIYADAAGQSDIATQTILSTETSIASRIKDLRSIAAWSIPLDERETLSNELAQLGDAYQGDWSEGSDEDDDDM